MNIKFFLWAGFPSTIVEKIPSPSREQKHLCFDSLEQLLTCHTMNFDLCILLISLSDLGEKELNLIQTLRNKFPLYPTVIFIQEPSIPFLSWALQCRIYYVFTGTISELTAIDCFQFVYGLLSANGYYSFIQPLESTALQMLPSSRKLDKTLYLRQYIGKNFHTKITHEMAAKICGLNGSQFSRTFKKENGVCFQDFLIQQRIDQAKKLFEAGDTNITMVALTVGFQDHSYFTRVFHRTEGCTPTDFINKLMKPTIKNIA